ncbi:MAG: hypothetical protein A2Z12_04840 [Actinobacteria bacterium RBG_16_68_21]|nr:MAG: hypothetical protein A2Z12_04840 [Actinobacteria bacterium RBG_16_68_21]
MFLSFSSLLAGIADETSTDPNRTAAFGFGLAIVPFVFVTLAFGSRHPRAPRAVLASLGLWLAISLVLGLLTVGLGISVGFGVAGMFSFRRDPPHSYRTRSWALVAGLFYTVLLAVLAPGLGLFAAGTVPFIAIGFADQYAENRARTQGP